MHSHTYENHDQFKLEQHETVPEQQKPTISEPISFKINLPSTWW